MRTHIQPSPRNESKLVAELQNVLTSYDGRKKPRGCQKRWKPNKMRTHIQPPPRNESKQDRLKALITAAGTLDYRRASAVILAVLLLEGDNKDSVTLYLEK